MRYADRHGQNMLLALLGPCVLAAFPYFAFLAMCQKSIMGYFGFGMGMDHL